MAEKKREIIVQDNKMTDAEKRSFIVDILGVGPPTAAELRGAKLDTAYKNALKRAEKKAGGGKVMYRQSGGNLKDVPAENQGLSKLPTKVRNKMGFKKGGGQAMKYQKGGMVYMKNGGVVKASNDGDKLVAACYDNGKKSKA